MKNSSVMKIKQIWQSFNFRNNKILNAKVDEPQEDDHIASKKYADTVTKYDTEKAQQFPNGSPKFSWMGFSLFDKTFKELFDDLFFPIVLPIYKEVSFTSVKLKATNEYGLNLFAGKQTSFSVTYDIDRGDRQSTTIPKIRVTTKAPVTVTEYNGNSGANAGEFGFTINLQNVDKIELVKTFEEVSTVKNDNYGNPYIPVEFTQNYEAKFDVLKILLEKYTIHQPIMYRKLVPDEDYNAIVDSINNGDSISVPIATVLQTFVKDSKVFMTNDNNNTFLFAFPRYFFPEYILNALIGGQSVVSKTKHNINDEVFEFVNLKSLKYFGVDIDYFFVVIDFGYFETNNLELNFSLEKFKN